MNKPPPASPHVRPPRPFFAQATTRRDLVRAACGTSLLLGLSAPARGLASVVMAMELPALTAESDTIVFGKVTAVVSKMETDARAIRTEVTVEVEEPWKGALLGKRRTLKIVQPGGVVGDLEMRVHGLPSFVVGERAVLFLRAHDASRPEFGFGLTGLGQGKRLVSADGSGRLLASPGDRSAAVLKAPNGTWKTAPGDNAVPLEDLRRQVRLLMGETR
ncbi:MAG: hypothetical protein KA712_22365 [Myxococcales bacterium]|nr:hypothetical protein [Myxococcales bacterium]